MPLRHRSAAALTAQVFGLGAIAFAMTAGRAVADDAPVPAAPTRAYTVFDPRPAAQLRSLCTDRPTKSTSPCTVDAGHVQIESDLFNVTIDRSGGATTKTYLATNPTLKLGLTNSLDFELNLTPYEVITTRDHSTGISTRQTGIGDLNLRLKWNLLGDDGGNLAIAISPFVKVPTARLGIGNGATEMGVIVPVNINLPAKFSLVIDPEIDLLENNAGDGRHANASGLLSLSRPVSAAVTLSVELWADVNFEPGGRRTQYSADLGTAWIPPKQPNLQFDAGVNFGLNRVTPSAQLYVGISRRF